MKRKIFLVLSLFTIFHFCKGVKPVPIISHVDENVINNGSRIMLKWDRIKDIDGYNIYFDGSLDPEYILDPETDSFLLSEARTKVEITVFREDVESDPYVLNYKVYVDTFIFYPYRLGDSTKPSGFYFDSSNYIHRVNARDTFIKKCDFIFEEVLSDSDTVFYLYGPQGWTEPWNEENNKISTQFSDSSIAKCDTAFYSGYADVVPITMGKTYFLWFTQDTLLDTEDHFAKIYITLKDDSLREYYVQIGYQRKSGVRWLRSE